MNTTRLLPLAASSAFFVSAGLAQADLIFQEDFSGYTAGNLHGQAHTKTGYASGSWTLQSGGGATINASSSLAYGTLGYTSPGKAATPASGFNGANATLDTSLTGPFGVLGLADGSYIGGSTVNGTLYVNINSSIAFDHVILYSTAAAFEMDNLAYNTTSTVPEPVSMALLGAGLVGLGIARRRRG